ncbi:MAG TPA: glycoside hydrolase family 2 TIM barrel-domain containing protein [Steroidobacteraceae bacterium]|nr:glycoside hydrolase family 2 TIM barrel-domain containing protein [Steroidobacteraceae bacterium]
MKRIGALFAAFVCCLAPTWSRAAPTEVLPLSGMGETGESPVYWDFKLDAGRGSGEWRKIAVPSQWEQQGFGAYYYGTQGRGKPDDDPIIPKETGTYRRTFEAPADWKDRDVFIVFEAAMTDTAVLINGKPAGATHQGGFYRFSYDITRLLKPGTNQVEVTVAKESSNTSVNRAERRGDYWTFGGIYRPVWLEARPAHHIAWTAIDARADGAFSATVHFDGPVPRNTVLVAQVIDASGKAFGPPLREPASRKAQMQISGRFTAPALWTAETPRLYSVKFELLQGDKSLHELTQRFGFRTVEVRANDGVYLNGHKVVLKGVNRHSFRPATGRTLSREDNYADARLIKAANMNAVRMSHYPPDPSFLEAADELGLYVLDELAGWQGSYDTPTGARLIGQMIRRDVNHPSILFWDNGNEGGWNTDNDAEFARWDPQGRKVLHPWAIHDDINTDHYEKYASTVKLSAGPQIFMPTEFLHGLYDGGIGAGFEDYWQVMGSSPTVAGGFFWAFADECPQRTDQDGHLDCVGNSAPDGLVGPHHEPEGSFYTVKQIWSPVQVSDLAYRDGALRMKLRNDYDFTSLSNVRFAWTLRALPAAGSHEASRVLEEGAAPGPDLAPRQERVWSLPVSGAPGAGSVLELAAFDPRGEEIWTWTVPVTVPTHASAPGRLARKKDGRRVTAGDFALQFNADGSLASLRQGDREIALAGPKAFAWIRDQRGFRALSVPGKLRKLELAPRDDVSVLARAWYAGGTLRSVSWRIAADKLLMSYELEGNTTADIYGIRFEGAKDVQAKRWVGAGPYRVWKNRIAGPTFGLHEVAYNDPVPGESFTYPEFPGFFTDWHWLEMRTKDASVWFENGSGIPFFGLHRPQPGQQPVIDLPDLGWSFLHAIPPIGSKFDLAEALGPQSQVTRIDGIVRGDIVISLTSPQ